MSKIVWDKAGEHFYETGVDRGVLYPTLNGKYQSGVPWNGLTSVSESPSGAESTAQYADNIKYLNLISAEEFGATVEAFTYPDEFAVCDGSAEPVPGVMIGQQARRPFGLSYRTLLGNDLAGTEYGYKIHLIYGATAAPSERAYATVNDSPEAITFSWSVTTTPVEVPGFKPTASLTIDSTKVSADTLAKLEDILYGSSDAEPRLPMPEEVFELIGSSRAITIAVTAPTTGGMSASTIKYGDLQQNIVINPDTKTISGTLKYVENVDMSLVASGIAGDGETLSGNFLLLQYATDPSDVDSMSCELLGATTNTYWTDEVETAIFYVTNKDTQTIKFSATKGADNNTVIYNLKGLTLETAASLG